MRTSIPRLRNVRLKAHPNVLVIPGGQDRGRRSDRLVTFFRHAAAEAERGEIVTFVGLIRLADGSITTGSAGDRSRPFELLGAIAVLHREFMSTQIEGVDTPYNHDDDAS